MYPWGLMCNLVKITQKSTKKVAQIPKQVPNIYYPTKEKEVENGYV